MGKVVLTVVIKLINELIIVNPHNTIIIRIYPPQNMPISRINDIIAKVL